MGLKWTKCTTEIIENQVTCKWINKDTYSLQTVEPGSVSSFYFLLLSLACTHSPPQFHSLYTTLFDFSELSKVLCIKRRIYKWEKFDWPFSVVQKKKLIIVYFWKWRKRYRFSWWSHYVYIYDCNLVTNNTDY